MFQIDIQMLSSLGINIKKVEDVLLLTGNKVGEDRILWCMGRTAVL